MDDLLTEFLTETSESLAVIDVELVKFEQDPQDEAILGNIFRLVHTIKGTCGFLGLPRLEAVAHAGENVLGKFRDGVLDVTPEAVTVILKCIDTIRDLLGELEEGGEEPDGHDQELIAELNAMADGEAAPLQKMDGPIDLSDPTEAQEEPEIAHQAPAGDVPPANEFGAPVAQELLDEVLAAGGGDALPANEFGAPVAQELLDEVAAAGGDAGGDAPPANEFGAPVAQELLDEVMAAGGDASPEPAAAAPAPEPEPEPEPEPAAAPPAVKASVPAKQAKKKSPAKKEEGKAGGAAASSIRVNVDVLEDLMTLVSELVLTRNQLLQMVRGHDDNEFTVPLQRLSHITSDLQEGVMKTRMQPIGNAWAKLPRIVRDLSLDSGKSIDLVMLGAETELDRQVLELIKDPLTHMVRNSCDHGLEDTEGRSAAGKPDKGVVTLNAFHEGGHIIIQIADDGRGLNMGRIREKIISNDLATAGDLENMTDQQIQQFIFAAGFSTAAKVTNVSGRGVGMDVVRTNVEKIGGTVELKSVEGKGSTFTIKIPLTLAIVSALIVECGGERFAIPQISVLELVRASTSSDNAIELINKSPVLRLRNRLLPLVNLRNLLKLQAKEMDIVPLTAKDDDGVVIDENGNVADQDGAAAALEESDEMFIVVTQVGANTFGIIVDRVFDTEEIVVKPVAPLLRDISFYSGNTILGDGSVIMILDPNGIATEAGQLQSSGETNKETAHLSHEDEKTALLIFRAGGDELKAVPLALIARLEEIDMEQVERSNDKVMVQYRGSLMPLIPFNPSHQFSNEGRQAVLVFTDKERSMGLAVDEIVDIIDDRLKIELATDQQGLIGSAVIGEKATDVIDAGYFLTQAFSDWFGDENEVVYTNEDGPRKALLVDDSPFFRNLLAPLLSVAGWQVRTAESADIALELREQGARFDVIISDIEMPGMNGFDFAETVRKDGIWRKIPMIALSSHASEDDFQRGRDVGFNDYVAKFDREALVGGLAHTVSMALTGG